MPSAWAVIAKTEYREGIRSRWFLASTLLGPLLMALFVVLPGYLAARGSRKPVRLALLDQSQPPVGPILAAVLRAIPVDGRSHFVVELAGTEPGSLAAIERRVAEGGLDGYLVLPPDLTEAGEVEYRGTNASSQIDMALLSRAVQAAVVDARAKRLGLSEAQVVALQSPVRFDARQVVGRGPGASGDVTFLVATAVAILLYMSILIYATNVMRSVIQEKTSRIVEVIAGCARPWGLMLGKVLGVGGLGLTQYGLWVGAALWLAQHRTAILAHFGVNDAAAVTLPHIGATQIASVTAYFLGGYFLYAAIFAAIGAASSSEREAQQAQMPVMMLLIGGFACFPVITSAPRDPASVLLTMIPFFSPVLMPMRCMLTEVPAWQLAGSLLVLVLTMGGVLLAAARIYRAGILMYGKRATLLELVRWLKAS